MGMYIIVPGGTVTVVSWKGSRGQIYGCDVWKAGTRATAVEET